MIDAQLVERLNTLAPNMYPLKAPKNYEQPCVIYNLLHVDPVRSVDSGASDRAYLIYQIDVYDESYTKASTLAKAIRDDLVEWVSEDVQSVAWTGATQTIDDTTEVALFRTMMTFLIFANV
ncbi:DUF3168 domain-containing protein [Sphingomonas melonis]|jgi:Protein of unknown function (DUF3168)|uniref:DUF3168 domain-containing protein n=1 Tax=Sphingomonas melonis TaxID=152682 RepID=UPI000376E649|nr:DUF3168 domain-containing protein [Sphingomonas melonis]ATI54168.1 DUF3168 domain-containing protein [Sphingomonas melonis]